MFAANASDEPRNGLGDFAGTQKPERVDLPFRTRNTRGAAIGRYTGSLILCIRQARRIGRVIVPTSPTAPTVFRGMSARGMATTIQGAHSRDTSSLRLAGDFPFMGLAT
jgi:hypothetical protein